MLQNKLYRQSRQHKLLIDPAEHELSQLEADGWRIEFEQWTDGTVANRLGIRTQQLRYCCRMVRYVEVPGLHKTIYRECDPGEGDDVEEPDTQEVEVVVPDADETDEYAVVPRLEPEFRQQMILQSREITLREAVELLLTSDYGADVIYQSVYAAELESLNRQRNLIMDSAPDRRDDAALAARRRRNRDAQRAAWEDEHGS